MLLVGTYQTKSNNTFSDTESRKKANKDSIKRKPTQRCKKPRIADGGEIESREKRRNSSMSDFENCEKRRIYNIQYVKKGESIVFNILHEVIEHWSLVRKIIQLFSYETSGNN